MTRITFYTEKRASGWAVVRSDGALIAIGFPSSREANAWLGKQLVAMADPDA